MLKLGLFFDSRKLGRDWNCVSCGQALSGTDSSLLSLALGLANVEGFKVALFATSQPKASSIEVYECEDVVEAARIADEDGFESLVLNCNHDESQMRLLKDYMGELKLFVWAQNSPSFEWSNAAYKSPAFCRLVTVSNIQRRALAAYPIYRQSVTIHNSINLDNWHVRKCYNQENVFVYIGALKKSKGFHHLADAWPKIRAEIPDAKLTVFGSPGLYGATSQLGSEGIAEHDYEKRILNPLGGSLLSASSMGVSFRGSVDKCELMKALSTSICGIVNPNHTKEESAETFCVSAVEVMAMGVPVIGGKLGGLIEVIGVNGCLVSSSGELAEAAVEISRSDPRIFLRAESARDKVRCYFDHKISLRRWSQLLINPDSYVNPNLGKDLKPRFYWFKLYVGKLFPMCLLSCLRGIVHTARRFGFFEN